VPCTIRAYQKTVIRRRVVSDPVADAWAQQRVRELAGMGIPAHTRRYRKDENLCVVYTLGKTQDVC